MLQCHCEETAVMWTLCLKTVVDVTAGTISPNAATQPDEIKVGVTAEKQFPYLLTINQVCCH